MDQLAPAVTESTFQDGLGTREHHEREGGAVEWLILPPDLATAPSFEFALRERVSRLSAFRHPSFATVRSVERAGNTLVVVSDYTPGLRLSALLDQSSARALPIDLNAALCLIRQLVPAIASLHETVRDAAHGALAPERLLVTPQGKLVVVDYSLGSALEQLLLSREKYWTDLRVALPRVAGLPRFDHVTDVTQLGIVALALVLGRNVAREEYPSKVSDVVRNARAISTRGTEEPLPAPIRSWLERMVQVDSRQSFPSAVDGRVALEQAIVESGYDASPVSLEMFLARLHGAERSVSVIHGAAPVSRSQASAVTPPAMKVPYGVASAPPPPLPRLPLDEHHEARPAPMAPAETRLAPVAAAEPRPGPMPAVETRPAPALASIAAPVLAPAASPVTLPVKPAAVATVAEAPSSSPGMFTPAAAPSAPAPWKVDSLADDDAVMSESELVVPDRVPSFGGPHEAEPESRAARRWWIPALAVGAVAVIAVAVGAPRLMSKPAPPPEATGTLVVTTEPPGARAVVDGKARGTTPLTLTLDAGSHKLELRGASGGTRTIPLTITAGQQVSQYVDLPKPTVDVGSMRVRSQPDGADVVVDNAPRGRAPVVVSGLAPGEHTVTVKSENGATTQTVTIEAGVTASVVLPIVKAETAPVSGWVGMATPFPVQIFESGALIGSSDSDRVMVAAGRHDLELRNDALGYKATRTVQVAAGKVSAINVEAPQGHLAINAQPWAEVWIDGEKVGETPIGDHAMKIGAHEVVFRHPDFGERKQTAIVTLAAPTRLIVDMRKP